MSNQFKNMQKIVSLDERQKQKQQIELQRASFVANTRLQLAQTFLNTLLGRPDVEIEKPEFKEVLTDISVEYANCLMGKLGIVLPTTSVE